MERRKTINMELHSRSGRYRLVFNQNVIHTVLWILSAIIYLVFLLKLEIYAQPQYQPGTVFGILFGCGCLLRWGWRLFWLVRLEWRRSAILKGEYRVAPLQPTRPAYSGLIPLVIKVRFKLIYIILFFTAWFAALFPWMPSPTATSYDIFLLCGWGTAVVIFAFFISWQAEIKITERGLKKNVLKASKTVEWSNANLFICYRLPSLIGKPQVIYYELSNQTTRITWMWVVDGRSVIVPWRPAIPDEQYQRQMQALTALATEKTGLPLYDLSEPWLKRKQDGTPKE